ncbi:hypothetical protein PEPS_21640 [Persicobacter psychrovividus]|uniref:Uncharacterized protein n=1 Tax=Persicobacter psychrovividus TaxID=387638 RepID=A0ABM7VFZ7_9BACT|nr:hypothetical protein PEPS_21640 [Persicobacter psychrovividus]
MVYNTSYYRNDLSRDSVCFYFLPDGTDVTCHVPTINDKTTFMPPILIHIEPQYYITIPGNGMRKKTVLYHVLFSKLISLFFGE